MRALVEADLGALRWTRLAAPHTYHLVSGEEEVATLHWQNPVETIATAEAAGLRWTLRRHGFLSPNVTIQDAESGKLVALLHIHVKSSLLQAPGGTTYRWERTGFWIPAWEFQSSDGKPVVNFEPVREETRLAGGLVDIASDRRADPNLMLLLVLGWYFIVQAWTEDEAVAASRALLDATSG